MTDIVTDLSSLLIFYIEQSSDEEKRFNEDQENCELKLCISVSHSNSGWNNTDVDLLMVYTRLIQSNEFIEENIDQIPNLFYIQSQIVSCCTGILPPGDCTSNKIMFIETVVRKDNFECETIFKTFVTRTHDGKKQKTQRSFTREISKHGNSTQKIRNQFSDDEQFPKPPTKSVKLKRNSFKKFSRSKKSKSYDKQNSTDNEDKLKNERQKLPPIKKPKLNFFKNIRNIFQKTSTISIEEKSSPRPLQETPKLIQTQVQDMKTFSTEQSEMIDKPTSILAKISLKEGRKKFEKIDEDIPFIDDSENEDEVCSNNLKSDSVSESFLHFDFSMFNEIHATINKIIKEMTCNCKERFYNVSSRGILGISGQNTILCNEIRTELKKFDKTRHHFIDCNVWICEKKNTTYQRKLLQSRENLQNLFSICHDIDEYFNESLCTVFVPFLKEIDKKQRKELCSCERKKKEKITSYIYSSMTTMKINGEFKDSFNKVTKHFRDCIENWITPVNDSSSLGSNNDFNDKLGTITCTCYKRRMQILAHFISHISFKRHLITGENNEFNSAVHHSNSCSKFLSTNTKSPSLSIPSPFNDDSSVFDTISPSMSPGYNNTSSPESVMKRSRKSSSVSMQSMKSVNDILQYVKLVHEIECPIETIEYFLKCRDFNNYEKGILKVLEKIVSIEHMCLFFYLTRKIVKYIDDPSCEDNEDIKRIMEYSERFLIKHYKDEIKTQGGLEKFVLGIESLD